jgi:hypothetical protein
LTLPMTRSPMPTVRVLAAEPRVRSADSTTGKTQIRWFNVTPKGNN